MHRGNRVAAEAARYHALAWEGVEMAYHYIESGLDNVWLADGYTEHKTAYGDGVSIHNTEGLHKAIGEWLVSSAKPLSGAELRFLRMEMDLSQKALSGLLGVEEQAVRRWEKARSRPFNGAADRLIRGIYAEYINGDGSIRAMVDRLAALDQVGVTSVRFHDTGIGWRVDPCSEAA